MNPLRQALKGVLDSALPRRLWLTRGPRNSQGIALTFDDGPHAEHTPRLLDELQQAGVSATFFVVGEHAARHPDLIRRIQAEGHTLGHHSYTHGEPRHTSAATLLAEVRRTRELLEDLTGAPTPWFRPPKGELTARKMWDLWRQDQTIVLWNVDPRDYGMSAADPLLRWCDTYRPGAGDILLFHDNHPHCIAAIAGLAAKVAEHPPLRFVSLNEWVSRPQQLLPLFHTAIG